MQREKIKALLTLPLALILAYLLVKEFAPGSKPPQAAPAASVATAPASAALPSNLPSVPALPAAQTLATAVTAVLTSAALPRDPFALRPLDEVQMPQPGPPAPTVETPSPSVDERSVQPAVEEKLRLKATLIGRHGKLAFINDQVVTEGQAVAGYTVVRIAPGHVVMTQGSKERQLRLAHGGTP